MITRVTRSSTAAGLIITGIMLVVLSVGVVSSRAFIDLHGTVTKVERSPDPVHKTYWTEYVIDPGDGLAEIHYAPGYGDNGLRRDIPVGASLDKRKWQLVYTVDGVLVNDFPRAAYAVFFLTGVVAIAVGTTLRRKRSAST